MAVVWGRVPRRGPWEELITFSYSTVNFACNIAHKCTEYAVTKVVMWGGVPDTVNHAKSSTQVSSKSIYGFWLPGGRNLPFSYAWRYDLLAITG